MRKLKSRLVKKTLLFMGVALVVAIGIIVVNLLSQSSDKAFESKYEASGVMLNYLLDNNISDFSTTELEDFKKDSENTLEVLQSTYPTYYNFCKGMFYMYDNDYTKAQDCFNMAMTSLKLSYYADVSKEKSLVNDSTKQYEKLSSLTQKVAARIYYEYARMAVELESYDVAMANKDYYDTLLRKTKNYDYLVTLDCWYSSIIMKAPNGSDIAVETMEDAYQIAIDNNLEDMIPVMTYLGSAYNNAGNSVKFISTELGIYDLAIDNEDTISQANIGVTIGIEYIKEDNYDKAIKYLLDSYQLLTENPSDDVISLRANSATYLALAYLNSGDDETALKYLKKADEIIDTIEVENTQKECKAHLLKVKAQYELISGSSKDALKYLDKAMDIYEELPSFSSANFDLEMYGVYGEAYQDQKNYKKARDMYERVEKLSQERNLDYSYMYLKGLYNAYWALGDTQTAYAYGSQLAEYLNNQIHDSENEQAAYMLEEFQSDLKDKTIDSLTSKGTYLTIIVIISGILLATGALFLIHIHRQKKQISVLNENLRRFSEEDALTGLYNRRMLDDYLTTSWSRLLVERSPITIAMIDVDFFKLYNDFYGHQKGDVVLSTVGKILLDYKRDIEFMARYGGEEFALIMPMTDADAAVKIFRRIMADLENNHIRHEKSTVAENVTMSIGFTTITFDGVIQLTYEDAIHQADDALYVAKKQRNCFRQYTSDNEGL